MTIIRKKDYAYRVYDGNNIIPSGGYQLKKWGGLTFTLGNSLRYDHHRQ